MSDWLIHHRVVQTVRRVDLIMRGLPAEPCNRWKRQYFQPVDVSLEYRIEYGIWVLIRVEATGPLCHADGRPLTDWDEKHIFAWLTPLQPTRANPGGVPDWVTELGRRYMPQPLADPTTEQ